MSSQMITIREQQKLMKHILLSFGLLMISQLCMPVLASEEVVHGQVAEAYIEMRTGPGRGYPIFYIVEREQQLQLLKQRTDWFKVRTDPKGLMQLDSNGAPIIGSNTKQGWVHVSQVANLLNRDLQPFALDNPELADFTRRKWEGGIMAGSFGGVDEISAYGGYHLTRNLSLELALSESFGNFSNGLAASINLVHQPFPHWRFSPFFTVGGGIRKIEPKSSLVTTEDRNENTLNVGVGLNTYITRRFILRLQYKNHTVLSNRDDDEEVAEWKIGLSAFF